MQARRVESAAELKELGLRSLKTGELAVVTLAAGAGSRWTQGAGVVKALHPFCKLDGKHRTFIETHLAKSRRTAALSGTPSLRTIAVICTRTALLLIIMLRAMSAVGSPSESSSSTSHSRLVRCASAVGSGPRP